jgi:uncharacterized protein (TIGR02271 family)
MSRTLTALFDDRSDAEDAKRRLEAASIDINHVSVHDKSSPGYSATGYSTHKDRGFWESVKDVFVPDEDRHTYEEGVRRGGFLLTASVDEHSADEAVRILEDARTVDIDQRSSEWRSNGWDYAAGGTSAFAGSAPSAGTVAGEREETIPIVEEELRVGKREVDRGSVRVRSYVVETPVHEQVSLRDEHVSVERRAVDLPIGEGDDAFRERSIEMTETAEEAVIAKEVRVREEVVVRKDVGEHVEHVDDTVRHTEVDVEETGGIAKKPGFADPARRDDRV